MRIVPVVSSTGKPLMPCTNVRARELVRKGKAVKRFNKGIFYIKLTERSDGEVQDVALPYADYYAISSDLGSFIVRIQEVQNQVRR